jgi:protein-S-isoprenylcysteine O-methyltransferase Ste14
MNEGLRLFSLALYGVGPAVALAGLLRRRFEPSRALSRVEGWRRYVPPVLLPVEWLVPPALIATGAGEARADWLAVRVAGLVVGVAGAVLLAWAAVLLGRFFVHEAAVVQGHALVTSGPYRLVRHPVYSGYLALLLGTGAATLNVWLCLLWPVSLLGILVQAGAEERLLAATFGQGYEAYARRTGRLLPRLWSGPPPR